MNDMKFKKYIFHRLGPFASKGTFPKLSDTIFPASPCFLLRSLLLKGLTIVQRVHSRSHGAMNKQIDGMIKIVSRAHL